MAAEKSTSNWADWLGFISLFISLVLLGIILFNTVRGFEEGIEQKIQIVQDEVNQLQNETHEINVKVAGVEAKLDVLITAWNLEMPASPPVASNQ